MKNIEMRFLTIFQILGRVQCNGKVGQVVVYILHVVAKEKNIIGKYFLHFKLYVELTF
jgi:hypothetical protein